jgi:nickel/cobalt exporter
VGAQGVLPADVVVRWTPLVAALTIVAIGGWMVVAELRRRRARGVARDHHEHAHRHPDRVVHSHGGVAHSHGPPARTTITWRSLFALGLAGGIIPSTSALLILLGTVAAGRAAFGVLLVVVFGLGMAAVLAGVGVLLVRGRMLVDRLPAGSGLGRLSSWAPLAAAVLVFGVGLWLTTQAMVGRAVL